jgi:acyl dehydratase
VSVGTVDPAVLGTEFEPYELTYEESDTIAYALGVGAGRDREELGYVWEEELRALPTQPVVAVSRVFHQMTGALGISGTSRVHGEQRLVLHRPPPPRGRVTVAAKVVGVWDKGAGAVLDIAAAIGVEGEPLATATFASFVRGGGGFGGERGSGGLRPPPDPGPPATVVEDAMSWNQALLYRLTGDLNPLHIDPRFAAESGFDRPIAHGLCTYGFAVRMVMKGLGNLAPGRIAAADARFVSPVYPGDPLRLELWKPDGNRVYARLTAGTAVAIDPLFVTLR